MAHVRGYKVGHLLNTSAALIDRSSVLTILIDERLGVVDTSTIFTQLLEIFDGLSVADEVTPTGTLTLLIADALAIIDVMYAGEFPDVENVLEEVLALADSSTTITDINKIIADVLYIDPTVIGFGYNFGYNFGETYYFGAKWELCFAVIEQLNLASIPLPVGTSSVNIEEDLLVKDLTSLFELFVKVIEDTFASVDVSSFALERFAVLRELVRFVGITTAGGSFTSISEEAITLQDTVVRSWDKLVPDSVDVTGTVSTLLLLIALVAETTSVVDASTDEPLLMITTAEELTVVENASASAVLDDLLQETLSITIQLVLDGEVWQCWVLNTDELKPSVYSNYNFNSYATIAEKIYALKSDGLYLLEGSDDAGESINSGVVLAKTNLGLERNKRFRSGYFGVSGNNIVLKVETENSTKYFEVSGRKTPISKDVYGKDWTFSLREVEELSFVELFPVLMRR